MDTTQKKRCFKCGRMRRLSLFYKHAMMHDGHLNKCKECTKRDVAEHREKNLSKVRAYDRTRFKSPARKAKVIAYQRKMRAQHPEKYLARQRLAYAVKTGKIVRPPCQKCGSVDRVQAHHHDYSKPLDVRWLCFVCHRKEHGQYKESA